jgi:hypothetical protein
MKVERVDHCDRRMLVRHIRAGKPLVITNLVRTWPAFEKWTPDYLAAACGDRPIPIWHYPGGKARSRQVKMSLADYLDVITSTADGWNEYYLESLLLSELSDDLYHDLPFPGFLNELPDFADTVFFGRDTGSCCHIHAHEEAVVFQMIGTKVFHLYHPDDARFLYFEPLHRDYRRSRIDFGEIDHDEFPLAKRLTRIEVPLERGDALYLPVHWAHWTVGHGLTFTLTRFFNARLHHYRFPTPGIRCLIGRLIQSVLARK